MTVRLFLAGKFLPDYVETLCASRRLPPKAAVSACRRHSFVEGIRNGGLDFVKAAVDIFKAWRLPAERRLFYFTVARQLPFFIIIKSNSRRNLTTNMLFDKITG